MKKLLFFLLLLPFMISCTSLFFQPDRKFHFSPKNYGYSPKEISFTSKDGTQLHGWFFPTDKPRGTIVQFHGNAENLSSHYLSLAWLTEYGYQLFTFDYRGYGKSGGEADPKGVYFDSLVALDTAFALHKQSHAKKFIVYGQSLGGAIALRATNDFSRVDKIDLLVMDSSFLSYKTVARRILARHWVTWLFSPLGSLLVSDEFEATTSLENFHRPLLVIHDPEDPVVPFSCGKEIFESANEPKEFWTPSHSGHIGIFNSSEKENKDRFINYLMSIP